MQSDGIGIDSMRLQRPCAGYTHEDERTRSNGAAPIIHAACGDIDAQRVASLPRYALRYLAASGGRPTPSDCKSNGVPFIVAHIAYAHQCTLNHCLHTCIIFKIMPLDQDRLSAVDGVVLDRAACMQRHTRLDAAALSRMLHRLMPCLRTPTQ
jgi:hypothetical protein